MNSNEIREKFLAYFESKSHQIVPSAPMVVKNDPTLMFTNAGMNQFKDIFLGNSPIKYTRVADSQKCLRVSGKHNDLEEVGHDTYHHTMFEMLGNWSFGDYFKEEAIDFAWELLVDVFKIPANRLYATVFEGNQSEGLEFDEEAKKYWLKHLPQERILNGSKKDNFWEMGDTGPCGPCSEIHVDIREDSDRKKINGKELVNKDHPLVPELWNLVFIQYNRRSDGSLVSLPKKHIDTGMGFERLCMVLQNKHSNYDTDVFTPIIAEIERITKKKYGENNEQDIAMRVISDHIRTIAFAIADGQLPSNNKAGYVIRRILRRAIRYGFTFLGQTQPFMYKLLPVLQDIMGQAYPEIISQATLIEKVLAEEEHSFLNTLETGINMLDQIIKKTKNDGFNVVSGKVAFELYDTYGFPLDLTELILKENGLIINKKEFDDEMQAQKDRSRQASAVETGDWVELIPDDEEEFVGYDYTETELRLTKYRQIEEKGKTLYHLVFNITPFYGESGGQIGDTGYIEYNGKKISIIDTTKENNLIIHITKELPENLHTTFKAVVNNKKRKSTECNHSATHLLHEALRKVLGTHVEQKGSLVAPDRLRFDFSHFEKLTDEQLMEIESIVNEKIQQNIPLKEHRHIPLDEAKNRGAMALFGEKYGDIVRAIQFGESFELCGGTHVRATGEIGLFKIISESAIAAGIRRIEAVTSKKALDYINQQIKIVEDVKSLLKSPKNVVKNLENIIEENQKLQKEIEKANKEKIQNLKNNLKSNIQTINGVNFISDIVSLDASSLKDLLFQLRGETDNLFAILGSKTNNKAGLSIMLSDDLVETKKFNANEMIKELAKEIRGGGGGQPFYATAGGKNPDGLTAAMEKAEMFIKGDSYSE